ncbi:hypothetical protein ENBRE01_0999 [Enteropsectra breve]|nr:hypothetical protein ENBRE01_0999 [Enteropsectra breve]
MALYQYFVFAATFVISSVGVSMWYMPRLIMYFGIVIPACTMLLFAILTTIISYKLLKVQEAKRKKIVKKQLEKQLRRRKPLATKIKDFWGVFKEKVVNIIKDELEHEYSDEEEEPEQADEFELQEIVTNRSNAENSLRERAKSNERVQGSAQADEFELQEIVTSRSNTGSNPRERTKTSENTESSVPAEAPPVSNADETAQPLLEDPVKTDEAIKKEDNAKQAPKPKFVDTIPKRITKKLLAIAQVIVYFKLIDAYIDASWHMLFTGAFVTKESPVVKFFDGDDAIDSFYWMGCSLVFLVFFISSYFIECARHIYSLIAIPALYYVMKALSSITSWHSTHRVYSIPYFPVLRSLVFSDWGNMMGICMIAVTNPIVVTSMFRHMKETSPVAGAFFTFLSLLVGIVINLGYGCITLYYFGEQNSLAEIARVYLSEEFKYSSRLTRLFVFKAMMVTMSIVYLTQLLYLIRSIIYSLGKFLNILNNEIAIKIIKFVIGWYVSLNVIAETSAGADMLSTINFLAILTPFVYFIIPFGYLAAVAHAKIRKINRWDIFYVVASALLLFPAAIMISHSFVKDYNLLQFESIHMEFKQGSRNNTITQWVARLTQYSNNMIHGAVQTVTRTSNATRNSRISMHRAN